MERDPLLQERQKTHGDFHDHAHYTQLLKETLYSCPKYKKLKSEHAESLEMICHKIGRILAGNENFNDHWDDIAGYAKLGSEACQNQ